MEKSCAPFHLSSELCVELRRMAIDSIENDLNMIVEEYGFWTKLTEKMKEEVVNLIFSDYIEELQPLILGCE